MNAIAIPTPPAPPNALANTVSNMNATLCSCLIERDEEVRALLRCMIAQEHLFLEGPPGTAKSLLCTSLAQTTGDAVPFEVLLTKFSTPDDLFGPLDVMQLKNGVYHRNVDGYMPTAHIVFVDEVWKASTAILNALLTIMQERTFLNGKVKTKCPMRIMVGASNEWPQADELAAAFDRFLVRRVVKPVSRRNLDALLFDDLQSPSPVTNIQDMDTAHAEAMALQYSPEAKASLGHIFDELAEAGIVVGDRRKRKAMKLPKAEAWLCNALDVQPIHLECLVDVLWSDPIEQPTKALEIITRIANPQQAELNRLLKEIDEIEKEVRQATGSDADRIRESAKQKLIMISKTAEDIGTERANKIAKYARKQWSAVSAANLGLNMKSRLAQLTSK